MTRVIAIGCFDCLHFGHVAFLTRARAIGDSLIIGLTEDHAVNKGPGRPLFKWAERAHMLYALSCVSLVLPHSDSLSTLAVSRADIYVKGKDWEGRLPQEEIDLCKRMKMEVRYLNTHPVYHTTDIITGKMLDDRIRAARQSVA